MEIPAPGPWRIFETSVFLKDLKAISWGLRTRIEAKLASYVYPQLRRQPCWGPNIRKLRGYEPDTWRYRLGPWRIFFEVDDIRRVVSVLTISARKDAY